MRTFDCESCGMSMDRDLNAAINIKHWGIDKFSTGGTPGVNSSGDTSRSRDHSAQEAAGAVAQQ